jgi:hypothetical protein
MWCVLLLGTALSLMVAVGIARQSLVIGSEAGGWVYRYLGPFHATAAAVALVATLIVAALLAIDSVVRGTVPRLICWLVAGFIIQALLRALTPFTLGQMFSSPGANSFYDVAARELASNVLGNFHALRESWPIHAQSNMPGKIMLVYAFRLVSERPDLMAWMVIAVSNVGMFLTYWFTNDVLNDDRTALWAAVLYLFVPAKLFFFPLMNTVTPVVILLCSCLLQRWLLTGRAMFAALLGVALYGLVFWEPLPLVMGLVFAALMARAFRRGTLPPPACVRHVLLALSTFTATYAVVWLAFGFDLASAVRDISSHASVFNREIGRPYWLWLPQNLLDFVLGVGVCQTVLVMPAIADGLINDGERWHSSIVVLTASVTAVPLLTNLMGVNRGEVIRLWVFLACFLQIPAAYVCARLDSRIAFGLVLGTTLLHDALGTAMVGFILP